jgi:hypothetical protein
MKSRQFRESGFSIQSLVFVANSASSTFGFPSSAQRILACRKTLVPEANL